MTLAMSTHIFQNFDTIDSRGGIQGMYKVVTTRTPTP
jgi:hypothetical protein